MNNTWENIKQEDSYNDDDSIDADGDDELNNDAEGVWSPDIEQSFQEALAIYPPCGRRKIILSEEGKMYGRNELIARYIKLRTGKTRTRKQVSSHIQVLAKRKTKDGKDIVGGGPGGGGGGGGGAKPTHLTSAQIISPLNTNRSVLNYANQVPVGAQQIRSQQAPQCYNPTNSIMNSQNTPQNAPPPGIWSHPGLQAENTKAALVAAAAANLFYPPNANAFTPEVLAAALATPASGRLNTPNSASSSPSQTPPPPVSSNCSQQQQQSHLWQQQQQQQLIPKTIGTHRLHLIEFSGFLEQRRDHDYYHKHLFVHLNPELHTGDDFECINVKEFADKFPDNELMSDKRVSYLVKFWVDLNYNLPEGIEGMSTLFAVTNIFEGTEMVTLSCSTKVCSFGNQVVEKVETEHSSYENGRYVYRFENSPMCEYMITFINKLKQLPEESLKNSVLENFSVLQLIKNHDTQEILLSLAYVFEVSTSEHGAQHVVYRLTNK